MDARRSQSLSRSSLSCLGPETDASDTLLDAATGLLRMAPKDSKRSWLKSTRILSFLSVALHSTLVVIHLLLMVVWWRGIEHRLVFPVEDQTVVSSVVTAILTTFVTIYSAALVFVTQKLSFRRSLRREQTLSATHDIATAWGGIASAALCVWNQKVVPAAITGVFSAFVYLANILVLHITSPALLSVGTFNATRSYSVPTQGLPAFNFSGYNLSSDDDLTNALASAPDYATASLSFLTYLNRNSTNFGLHAGTLYDVLGGNGGPVDATVNATGFNLTCGYLTNVTANFDSIGDSVYWSFNISGTSTTYLLESIEPGIISTFKMASVVHGDMETAYTATFYSTVPILDSEDNGGHWVALDPPMESGVSAIQLFRCSPTLVHQTAMVNSQSRLPISFAPEITKNASTWLPFTAAIYNFSDAIFGEPEGLINAWEPCYSAMPAAPISISDGLAEESVADMFLREQLHLFPFNSTTPASITLHDLENTFSNLAAAMFWTLGHNPPLPVTGYDSRLEVSLIEGNAAVTELFLEAHLNLSIIAVVSGLAASAILLFLSLQSVRLRKGGERETDGAIDGVGMLHAIWLYRNHPELKTRLEPVDHPTDTNLREAAMVRTRLSRSLFHPHRSWELTELKPEHMHETTSLVGDENAMTVSVSHSMLPEKSTYTGHDTDFLTSPNTTPNLAPISREAPARSWSKSTGTLSLFSVALHVIFVAIHVALVVVWWRELEQRLVFPLEKQGSVSFIITTIVTTIVAIYSAVLVFLTQKMSFRRSLCVNQTLTATHDNVAAWGGIGSAAFCIWDQQAVPASVTGALSVFVYLANILFLHITSPVLLSVQTFNFTQSVPVSTQSLPAFNFSGYDLSSNEDRVNALTSAEQYAAVSLPFLPYLNERTTNPGLGIGTLYDVLNPNPGTGNAYVNAVGFNITCGYLDLNVTQNPDFSLEFSVDGVTYWVGLTSSGVISTPSLNKRQISVAPIVLGGRHASEADAGSTSSQSKVPILPVIFYSTIPILDSNNNTGPPVILDPPMMFTNVSVIQFFRCSQALVHGTAIVDSQSGQLISAETTLNKAAATWLPFPENTSISSDSVFVEPEGFIIAWESWYCAMPMGSVHLTSFSWDSDLSVADLFLMQQLNLIPSNGTVPDHVTLHDLENQLSHLIASMFWILGHVAPPPGFNATTATSHDVAMPPVLLTGNSTVTEISVQARVNLSIIAVSAGLFASATLLLLSLRISRFRKAGTHEYDVQIDGAGMLHAIWLYCGHPELETLIEQVEDPTDVNLREAGMVTTRFGVPEASS